MGVIGREVLMRACLKTERVEVPELGGEIILRELSAAQSAQMTQMSQQNGATDGDGAVHMAAWVLVAACVDESGAPILTTDDIDMLLATKPLNLILRLATRVQVLSGLVPGAIESAEKN